MNSQDVIDESNDRIRALMDIQEEMEKGGNIYLETSRNNISITGNKELAEALNPLIEHQSAKHRELVEAIQKVEAIKDELGIY